jgi:hypothetical protein
VQESWLKPKKLQNIFRRPVKKYAKKPQTEFVEAF